MSLPPELLAGGARASRVAGGDINEGWQLVRPDGRRSFVKTRADPGPGEYAAEAAGLRWLGEPLRGQAPGALQVPEVLAAGEDFLELEWIESGGLDAAGVEELGRGLAAVHAAGAPAFGAGASGAGAPLRIGRLVVPNEPLATWPEFYVRRRLLALLPAAGLTPRGVRALERVCERIEDLAGPAEPPARLHGDLWSGNVLGGRDGRPWLIDPLAHGGHREVDLAMLELFGGPPARSAYREAAPLAAGWRDRVELWQLFPLLVHAALFGGSYRGSVERIAGRYAGSG